MTGQEAFFFIGVSLNPLHFFFLVSRDVQVLRYQNIGSMHIPRCREERPPLAALERAPRRMLDTQQVW